MLDRASLIGHNTYHVSRYFQEHDVVAGEGSVGMGIDNKVYCPSVRENVVHLAGNVLDKVWERFGPISLVSWYRCEELERHASKQRFAAWCARRALPENDYSWYMFYLTCRHPRGCAATFRVDGVDCGYVFDWIKNNLTFDQLERVWSDDCIYVSYTVGNNSNQILSNG